MQRPKNDLVLLARFERLRVADVRDALDTLSYRTPRSIDPAIRPLFQSRARGFRPVASWWPEGDGVIAVRLQDVEHVAQPAWAEQ